MSKTLLITLATALLLPLALVPPADAGGSCSAWVDCSDGSTKDCTGSSSCLVGSNYVECDGSRWTCPTSSGTTCTAQLTCPSPPYSQEWFISCTDSSGNNDCITGTDYVSCNGETTTCQECEDGPFTCLSSN